MTGNARPVALGLQLYSLQELDEDLPEIIRQVGAHGFDGVEFADRIQGADPVEVRSALADTGLEAIAAHVSLSQLEADLDRLVELFATLDCTRLVIPHIRPTYFLTRDRVDTLVDRILTLADGLADEGLDLLIHNTRAMHYPMLDRFYLDGFVETGIGPQGGWCHAPWAFDRVTPKRLRGDTAFDRLVEQTGSAVGFEIDTKAVRTAGRDMEAILDRVGDRLHAVHLSNARSTRRYPPAYRTSGIRDGVVDVETSLRTVLDREVEWLIVESEDPEETLSVTSAQFGDLLGTLGVDFDHAGDTSAESRAVGSE